MFSLHRNPKSGSSLGRRVGGQRRGIIVVLTAFLLVVIFAFMALTVDSGRIVLTETEMQSGVDAAALAASLEIAAAVHDAGQNGTGGSVDANSIAVEAARQMAATVAQANGVYVDPGQDVRFGKRRYDASTGTWPIEWGGTPVNVVQVVARKTNTDPATPDSQLPLAFGWAVGRDKVSIQASATAFVEARDMVLVLDFSGSMNDDSTFGSSLELCQVESALDNMWDEMRTADPKWVGTNDSKFPADGFGLVNSYEGTYISSSDTDSIMQSLGLKDKQDGYYVNLYPQTGRYNNGNEKGKPSNNYCYNLWHGYVDYTKGLSGPYKKKYGYRTLMSYMQRTRPKSNQSEDLWRTSHYPFHAVKEGASLFLDFLDDLDFGDEVGVVSYGTWAEWEDNHYDGEFSVDISDNPITNDYQTLDAIQRRHQASHYDAYTGMGDGIRKGREMLVGAANDPSDEGHMRYGARPTLIVMTDGLANRRMSGWSLPAGFSWADWTDYDGDGVANYSTSNSNKQYAFWEATEAIKRGITVHTIAVGQNADRDIMRAIAFAGEGVFISVPGGATVDEMESQMRDAFGEIGAKVPPSKLVYEMSPTPQ